MTDSPMVGRRRRRGAIDASNLLNPNCARGEFQTLGPTMSDTEVYREDAALERRFQPISWKSLPSEETVEILQSQRPRYEEHPA